MFEISNLKFKHILNIEHLILDHPITCIVGASGSGKTTLLRHLNKLYVPDTGEISYNGDPLSSMDAVALRRRVVMLGQTPIIYDGTVGDNLKAGLIFALKPVPKEKALRRVLEQVGLVKHPDDWCDKLSGGEKQRLCLARVLLMDGSTYLLDEPSAALDKETEDFIITYLAGFVREQGKSLVIVTHSEQVSNRFPGSVVRITQGRAGGYEHE